MDYKRINIDFLKDKYVLKIEVFHNFQYYF